MPGTGSSLLDTQMLRILYIEDDEFDASLAQEAVSRHDDTVRLEICQAFEDGMDRLAVSEFDIVLIDLGLPGMTTDEVIAECIRLQTHPIAIMTGSADTDAAYRLGKEAGASIITKGADGIGIKMGVANAIGLYERDQDRNSAALAKLEDLGRIFAPVGAE